MTEEQRPKQRELERETRRLEKLRTLRLVERPPVKLLARTYTDYEPKDAA
jgi:hypothetical protein